MRPAIGGYFEFELPAGEEFHSSAIRLNTGRNAFELVLESIRPDIGRVFLPRYICNAMLAPIKRRGLTYDVYPINDAFMPRLPDEVTDRDIVVLVNYFGLLEDALSRVHVPARIVMDNCQAFFCRPAAGHSDTIYSGRKYFGVPDGAYLYTSQQIDAPRARDTSHDRTQHLLERIDLSPEDGYAAYQANEDAMAQRPLRGMSALSQRILASIGYEAAAARRSENFAYLHSRLRGTNALKIPEIVPRGPMAYPLLVRDESVRKRLQGNRIYCPRYWPELLALDPKTFEHELAKYLVPLPIDQRYGREDMERILDVVGN